jgi:hypothetical protein
MALTWPLSPPTASHRCPPPTSYHRLLEISRELAMTKDELIHKLHQRQNNGMTDYVVFGDLVAMVPSDQVDEWQAVLAKATATDARRDHDD